MQTIRVIGENGCCDLFLWKRRYSLGSDAALERFQQKCGGITGDIDLSSSRIVFQNGTVFELSYVGSVPGIIENTPENLPTQIYRIVKPQNPILLHGNALCDQSAYYVAWVELPMGLIDGVNVLLLDFIKGRETPRANMDMSRKCGGVSLTREVGKH